MGRMEKATLDMSSGMVFLGGFCLKPKSGGQACVRFSTEMSSGEKRAFLVKAWNLITTSSGENSNDLAPKSSWGFGTSINGSHDPCPWISSRESCVLDVEEDEYGGLIVKPECLPKMEGFKYHHAEQIYVKLTYGIPEGPNMLPANAYHQVGVGGFILKNSKEVLVLQEKHYGSAEDIWKLPTGFILENENFNGAVREVKEETGIDTEFVKVIAFRHAHQVAFQKSDLFFICLLKPLPTQIAIDEIEIQAAKWMPLAELVSQPCIQEDGMFKKIVDICIARLQKCYCGLAAAHVISKFDARSSLYYNVVEPEDYS